MFSFIETSSVITHREKLRAVNKSTKSHVKKVINLSNVKVPHSFGTAFVHLLKYVCTIFCIKTNVFFNFLIIYLYANMSL